MKPYSNPNWEPHFHLISPFLSKLYFSTNIGPLKKFIAILIFKKLDWMEQRDMRRHDD